MGAVLESLAGPGEIEAGLEAALDALVAAVGADQAVVFQRLPSGLTRRPLRAAGRLEERLTAAAHDVMDGRDGSDIATAGGDLVLAIPLVTATRPAAALVV